MSRKVLLFKVYISVVLVFIGVYFVSDSSKSSSDIVGSEILVEDNSFENEIIVDEIFNSSLNGSRELEKLTDLDDLILDKELKEKNKVFLNLTNHSK